MSCLREMDRLSCCRLAVLLQVGSGGSGVIECVPRGDVSAASLLCCLRSCIRLVAGLLCCLLPGRCSSGRRIQPPEAATAGLIDSRQARGGHRGSGNSGEEGRHSTAPHATEGAQRDSRRPASLLAIDSPLIRFPPFRKSLRPVTCRVLFLPGSVGILTKLRL